jgi:acetylornithine/N-succinyldiaminopimelate aminotransferase
LSLEGSFHGRTLATLKATGQPKFHVNFGPFPEGFDYIPGGNIPALERALSDASVCALIIEPVQGESGIIPQSKEFMEAARKLCTQKDIILILDEIQSGVGRLGTFLAEDTYGVKGDVVTLAKGLAGGIPVGAVLASAKTAEVLESGDHGSTFGGNVLAASCGLVVLERVTSPEFLAEIVRKGERIAEGIRAWASPKVKVVRGRGLMLAVDIAGDAWSVLEKAIACADGKKRGLLALTAGAQTLRLLPPYTITDAEIDEGLEILSGVL